MSELSSSIIGAAAGIVAAIISGVVSVGILNHKISVITRHLGFGDDEASMKRQLDDMLGSSDKSITSQLSVVSKSISEQLGVGIDDKSLSRQHDDLKQVISAKLDTQSAGINIITQKINDEEIRRNSLDLNQQQIRQCVQALIAQWENSQSRISQLEEELQSCKNRIVQLRNENAALRLQIDNQAQSEGDEFENGFQIQTQLWF